MSADMSVIICISIKTCAQIDTVGGYGTGVSGELQTGEASAASAGSADEAGGVDAIDPGAGRASGENFPVALRMLPARYRKHLMAVYSFARTTDDIGDRAPPDRRLGLLGELEADVRRLYARDAGGGARESAGDDGSAAGPEGPPRSRVVSALGPAVAECEIPMQPFSTSSRPIGRIRWSRATRPSRISSATAGCPPILSAESFCTCSAAFPTDRAELSDSVCTGAATGRALAGRGRGSARRADLPARSRISTRYGCTEQDLAQASAPAPVRALLAFEVAGPGACSTPGRR